MHSFQTSELNKNLVWQLYNFTVFPFQVKNLITCRPEDEVPVRDVTIRKIPRYISQQSSTLRFSKTHSVLQFFFCNPDKVMG